MRIESLLSARLFIAPQLAGGRLYFLSNLTGRLSLFRMEARPGGSVPEPLLPPDIALQNPHLEANLFRVFPKIGRILVMIDRDGDENYQPMLIPLNGGYPEPAFGKQLANHRVHCQDYDVERNIVYLNAESRSEALSFAYQGNLKTGQLLKMAESKWGCYMTGVKANHTQAIVTDAYTVGDHVLYHWTKRSGERRLLYGVPLEDRQPGEQVPLNAIGQCHFTPGRGLLFTTALFSDTYGLGYLRFKDPQTVKPVKIIGALHEGLGELTHCRHLKQDRYALTYNIDGVSWLYEGEFNEEALTMKLDAVICGQGEISNGVLESEDYEKRSETWALSYSTATSPTQIYMVSGKKKKKVVQHTHEAVLGIPDKWLSAGEEASFISFDGQRISARLYLPAPALGISGPRPVVYYVHGGPQSQERPDFAWFSMPLIQFLTLNGFAVLVPNARGSTGYGLNYTKKVDRDWGGEDRQDHVHALTVILPQDKRLDAKRAGVVGRSYGGYMTLTLAARHPELWSAAVDMFGPYDLLTFMERIPETWKPYFAVAVGDPAKDREFLIERSPRTYIDNIACPLLVIQGKNDPRVIERESRDVVEQLRKKGKQVEYLMFENEGHDVLKFENRVACYNAITEFFRGQLRP